MAYMACAPNANERSPGAVARIDLRALFVLAALVGASGCSTVAPYERERLAQPDMQLGHNPEARSGQEHAVAYREGSSGATGSSGGGCGCN